MNVHWLGKKEVLAASIIALGILTLELVFTGALPALRPALVFAFLFFAPGAGFVAYLPKDGVITQITLTVALSLAIDTIVVTILLYAHTWSYPNSLLILYGISLVGLLLNVIRPKKPGTDTNEKDQE